MDLDFSLSEAFGFDFEGEEPDFSIKDFGVAGKTDGIENQRYLQPRIYESIGQKLLFEHACDMVSGLRLEPGMRMFALVSGNFIFGDVLEAMVTELGLEIRRMTIQSLSMSQANVDSLRNMIDTCFELESLRLVLSDYFYSHEKVPGRLVPYIYERLDVDDVLDVAFASVHTKIATVETTDGLKVVMDGSANLRSSGIWGRETSERLQRSLIGAGYSCGPCGADGSFGHDSVRALQRCLNDGRLASLKGA